MKNDSLEVPSGFEGIVIDAQKFSRRMSLTDDERKKFEKELKDVETDGNKRIADVFGEMIAEMEKSLFGRVHHRRRWHAARSRPRSEVRGRTSFGLPDVQHHAQHAERGYDQEVEKLHKTKWPEIELAIDARDRKLNSMKRGDELRSGVLQMVKVYICTKRVISVGDKMAGRLVTKV